MQAFARRLHATLPGWTLRERMWRSWPWQYLRMLTLPGAAARAVRFADTWHAVPPPVPAAGRTHSRLAAYVDAHTTGRGIWKWRHYFEVYERHCAKFVGRPMHLLEVGVYSGGSLDMWRDYFGPQCQITAIDIEPAVRAYEAEGVRILIGDQGDAAFWNAVLPTLPRVDLVVDDGGHRTHQQIATMEALLPHMNPGGVYVCEDIHDESLPVNGYIAGLLSALNVTTRASHPQTTSYVRPSPFQASIRGIHAYPFLTVFELRDEPLAELIGERMGTEWQPFYDPSHKRPPAVR